MEDRLQALEAELVVRERAQRLIGAIDEVRDTLPEPVALLAAIVDIVAEAFDTTLCMLAILNEERDVLELKAVKGSVDQDWLTAGRNLAEQTLAMDRIAVWAATDLPADLLPALSPASWYMATMPIKSETTRLGVLLLTRAGPFENSDVDLLKIAESQIDSAILQVRAYHALRQRNKELEAIYRLDHIRDQHQPFEKMLGAVLQELLTIVPAEIGFVMLYNWTEDRLELQAATHDDLFRVSEEYGLIQKVADETLHRGDTIYRQNLSDNVQSVLCLPLELYNVVIGIIGLVNRYGPHGFEGEDRRLLKAIASQMDTAIFERLEYRRLRDTLNRVVGRSVLERIMADPDMKPLRNERAVLTVLYSDIRGSTRLAEQTEPALLLGFINDYLKEMAEVVMAHGGTVDKFVGDEVMALFGAPLPQADHALRAVRSGLAMQAAHQKIMVRWQKRGIAATPIGIGIASGDLIVGEMGSPQRTEYTVIGRVANLGSRLCDVAQGGQILISQATYNMIRDQVEATPLPDFSFKGIDREVTVYHVTGLSD